MSKQQLVALGIRIAAIFSVLYIIQNASTTALVYWNMPGVSQYIYIGIMLSAVFIILCLLAIKFPLSIAGKLIPGDASEKLSWNYSLEDIQCVAFSLLGLIVLVISVPNVFYWFTLYIGSRNSATLALLGEQGLNIQQIGGVISTCVEIAIGIWLVLGAKGFGMLLHKLRYAAVEK